MEKIFLSSHIIISLDLPQIVKDCVDSENYEKLDELFKSYTSRDGIIFEALSKYRKFKEIEFIISLRESKNDWEEDGIWHDDGSRILAFSLSLTSILPDGGILELRKKGSESSEKISTPNYGDMIVFKTGFEQYEHKINRVINGKRLIIAGWCT